MNQYTLEQKAAAFDALWDNCGKQRGELWDYKHVNISRPGCPDNEAVFVRIARYVFKIMSEGESLVFRDVLHSLATDKARKS